MIHQFPSPTTENALSLLIRRLTCQACAGTGSTTTCITSSYDGRLHRNIQINQCLECDGHGIQKGLT